MKKKDSSSRNKNRPKRIRRRRNDGLLMLISVLLVAGIALLTTLWPKTVSSNSVDVQQALVNDYDTALVPTPLRNIARGEKLGDVPFAETKWPRNRLLKEYVQDAALFRDAVALTPLAAHVPIALSTISKKTQDGNAVVEGIPDGMRAITVKVDSEAAIEGWARSGNFVDVIVLRLAEDKSLGMEAKVIAENVKILSAGRSVEPLTSGSSAPRAPATVTLLVSQEDALRIKTAATAGKLTFSLRGVGDQSPTKTTRMDQKRLLGTSRTIVPQKSRYTGRATGPDGNSYVLGPDSRWIRAGAETDRGLGSSDVGSSTQVQK